MRKFLTNFVYLAGNLVDAGFDTIKKIWMTGTFNRVLINSCEAQCEL